VNELSAVDAVRALRMQGDPRYFVSGPAAELAALKRRWETATAPGNEDDWTLQKILAGEPTVYAETSEHFVAQMLNLDQFGAIDFKKGCYTGQEVIARAHYRGGVKRHMVRASCRDAAAIKPGDGILAPGSPVAEVVDAQRDGSGTWQMLLVIQDDSREMSLVHAPSGAAVSLV
jgi:folate-binding protein YgfZ